MCNIFLLKKKSLLLRKERIRLCSNRVSALILAKVWCARVNRIRHTSNQADWREPSFEWLMWADRGCPLCYALSRLRERPERQVSQHGSGAFESARSPNTIIRPQSFSLHFGETVFLKQYFIYIEHHWLPSDCRSTIVLSFQRSFFFNENHCRLHQNFNI